jgi:alkylation response protein AidB-like acyl-CoA dehydrogenase
VGLQGLGRQEMATQNALRHALERRQFKAPIASMPAMRHLLLRLQALTEAQRVIAYRAALDRRGRRFRPRGAAARGR